MSLFLKQTSKAASICGRRSLHSSPILRVAGKGSIPGWNVPIGNKPEIVSKMGLDLANEPLFNKGTAFPMHERDRFALRGLLPPRIGNIETQIQRVMGSYNELKTDLDRYSFLMSLQDRNETLFYRILLENVSSMLSVVYTPTVGQACLSFGHLWRRRRGMYFSTLDRGQFAQMVHNWPSEEMDIIVVTDGGRILGLGDLGAHGMGIPIGKSSLYVAGAGIHPARILPVVLDVGTNNEALINDPLYLGVPHKRLTGDEYTSFVDEFMHAVRMKWPNVCVQFEDFSSAYASPILNHYRDKYLCFNDDIQGTGAVILAGVMNALKLRSLPPSALADQRIVCLGAGAAGLGVLNSIHSYMSSSKGKDMYKNFWVLDDKGLITSQRKGINAEQMRYARKDSEADGLSLLEVVKQVKPTILFGMCTVGGLFTEDIIREMSKHVDRPIIFPLSNPTSKAECSAEQAFKWSDGRCIFASGSPFAPVKMGERTYYPTQGNNMFIFPGLGMGAVAVRASKISDSMLFAASLAVSQYVTKEELDQGKVFPDIKNIRSVSYNVAKTVAQTAIKEGIAREVPENLDEALTEDVWYPNYSPLVYSD